MIKTILIVILAVAFFGLAPSGIAQTQASSKDGVPSNQVRIQNDGQYEVRLDISGIHF